MRRAQIIGVFIILILSLFMGCQTPVPSESIVGTWECTNLREIYPDPYIKNAYAIFGNDGVVTSYLVDAQGHRMDVHKYHYHFDGTFTWNEENPTTVKRIYLRSNRMTTTITEDSNADNVGYTLKYRRVLDIRNAPDKALKDK